MFLVELYATRLGSEIYRPEALCSTVLFTKTLILILKALAKLSTALLGKPFRAGVRRII